MGKPWYQVFTKDQEQASLKTLKSELELLRGELQDSLTYNEKFFDTEPSGFTGAGTFELAGIETTITPSVLLRLFSTEPWVYSAVMAIAETIGGIPWKLKKRTIIKKTIKNDVTGESESVDEEVWTDVSGSTLFQLFQFPNHHASRSQFLQSILIDLICTGDAYIYLDSDKDLSLFDDMTQDDNPDSPFGRLRSELARDTFIKGMYKLPSQLIVPVPKAADEGMGLHGYVMNSAEGQFAFLPAELVHIKFPNPLSAWNGLSPLMACILRILLDRYSTEHMLRFYKSGARLGGMIETDKNLTKEQITRMQRSFENDFTGRQNFYRTIILPNGMTYKPIEQNPIESSVIELAKANREAILSCLRVPPIKVGIMDHANYANAKTQLEIFYDDTIKPRCTMITDAFNMKRSLMPDNRSYKIEFDFSEISVLQEDFQGKATAAKLMIDSGLSINEVRKMVWKAQPVKDGEKVKAIEDIKEPTPASLFGTRSAPADGATSKEGDSAHSAPANPLAGLPGPTVTSIMNIVGRVTRGKIKPEAGAAMISAFGVPLDLSYGLVGLQPPAPPEKSMDAVAPPNQPELGADVKPTTATFEERVAQLTAQFISRDKLDLATAIEQAIAQAEAEGLNPTDPNDPTDGAKSKPSVEEYITAELTKMDPESTVTQATIDSITQSYIDTHGPLPDGYNVGDWEIVAPSAEPEKTYSFGMSKDQVVGNWKSFIDKTEPLIAKRKEAVDAWFKKLLTAVKNQIGANIKSYGIHKSRDKDDADEITDAKNYDTLIAAYIAEIDKSLNDAYEYGFADTLVKFTFDQNNEVAKAALKTYGASRIKGITETTMGQINDVLTEAFAEGVAVTEISQRLDEKFAQIDSGRAETIARTETLTAVSLGREGKRDEFKEQFPDTKLLKMWVSAQDDKVRDSHADLDGVSVGVDEEFKDGLRFPRDPDGEAEEVINCRCTDITFAEDDKGAVEDSLPTKDEGDDE